MAPAAKDAAVAGPAVGMSDDSLVELLKRPPKHVPELRTREGYRRYFAGMPEGERAMFECRYYSRVFCI